MLSRSLSDSQSLTLNVDKECEKHTIWQDYPMVDSMIDEYQKIVHLGQRVSAEVFCSRVLNKKNINFISFFSQKSQSRSQNKKKCLILLLKMISFYSFSWID